MAIEDIIKSLQEIELSELTVDNIGSWPVVVKAAAWVLAFVLIVTGGYYGLIQSMEGELKKSQAQERSLKVSYTNKAHEAANLEAYRQQMVDIEENFGTLLSQLPSDTEVPGLLDDISNAGVSNGLQFNKIGLLPENKKEFYIELPIAISVEGTYHDIGAFVSSVAALPRIVTLHDFTVDRGKTGGNLVMKIQAKTYRYKE
jgi:type IV pilus assembly protein PilO|tara:strand:- start:2170 stop:2772 length:603 start_codon:yes stop_codon:yes gene_type:complete